MSPRRNPTGPVVWIVVLVVIALVVVFSSAFIVPESQQALVTEFGKPVGDPITEPGLHWRTPFIQKVHYFEQRLLEYDGDPDEIPTRDKKFIFIDTFARWRIIDPLRFFQSVRDETGAKVKLDDIIDSETRDAISSQLLIEAVRNTNRQLLQDAEVAAVTSSLANAAETAAAGVGGTPETSQVLGSGDDRVTIEHGRKLITREILERAKEKISNFGIELVDVQIKAINYVQRVQERVYERMVSERQQIAGKYSAEGEKIAAEIQGRIEKERNGILSEAYREAETIKGEAEAEAARIYAETYGRDAEFYAFWRSLEIYRDSLDNNLSLVISTDSDFFRYLRSAGLTGGVGAR